MYGVYRSHCAWPLQLSAFGDKCRHGNQLHCVTRSCSTAQLPSLSPFTPDVHSCRA